jgi:hypothetical protein
VINLLRLRRAHPALFLAALRLAQPASGVAADELPRPPARRAALGEDSGYALQLFFIGDCFRFSKITSEYVEYYNQLRPHQRINRIPKGVPPNIIKSNFSTKNIRRTPIIGGLHHHYWRNSA